ncbi:MAG TPA: BON domain-containing protein [Pyrinomonadaceae bacterium]|nr:BON domain-containing protein [Pyrinomonadaceae bacterium]
MPRRYNDRDYDRDAQYYGQYNTRSESEYGGGYTPRSDYGRDWESERYGNEGRFPGDENLGRYSSGRRAREHQSGRENYWGRGWENERDESNRESRYGSYGRSGAERGYSEGLTGGYSERYNYPAGRSTERYGERGRGYDYDRTDYDRGRYDREEGGRGWWDRASDEVASWFGDEEAERRRRMDEQRAHRRGRGPKGYRRSDERIKEDVNDRLGDDYYIDASDIEVSVQNQEVTLTGTVNNRNDKRRAEDLAESVSGVSNVENRLRVKQSSYGDYGRTSTSTGNQAASNSNISGTPGTSASSAAAGGRTSGT